MSHRLLRLAVAAGLLVQTGAACGTARRPVPPPPPPVPVADIRASVFVIGDGGDPAPGFEPVLAALTADVRRVADRAWVVFLGDNVYPAGIPAAGDPERPEAERRLLDQVRAAVASGAETVFIPGNHDWDRWGGEGWDAIRRQGALIADHGAGRVRLLPEHGCPGPVVLDLPGNVRLVLLDTQWWLHGHARPYGPDTQACGPATEAAVTDSLRAVLRSAGTRQTIVAGHHPLQTGGKHGGAYGVREHVFPLTELHPALWIPLPVIGSLYPLARRWGITDQDLFGSGNEAMRDSLLAAFASGPPLLYAAGHDHDLQVHRGDGPLRYTVVSGAGYYGHTTRVGYRETTLIALRESGYMRVDVAADGRVRLAVIVVDETGTGQEAFGMWLD